MTNWVYVGAWVAIAANFASMAWHAYRAIQTQKRRCMLDKLLTDLRRREVYLLDAIQEVESFTLQGWIPAKYLNTKQKETRH